MEWVNLQVYIYVIYNYIYIYLIILKILIPYNSKYNFHLKDLTSKSNGCCEQATSFRLACNYDIHRTSLVA